MEQLQLGWVRQAIHLLLLGEVETAEIFLKGQGVAVEKLKRFKADAPPAHALESYLLAEYIKPLLPGQFFSAVSFLQEYFDTSEVFIAEQMEALDKTEVVSFQQVLTAMQAFSPEHVRDSEAVPKAVNSLDTNLLELVEHHKEQEAQQLLVRRHAFKPDEAEEYLSELKARQQRNG